MRNSAIIWCKIAIFALAKCKNRLKMDVRIAEDWKALLQEEFDKPYFAELVDFVKSEYASRQIFPAARNIFRAFDKCPLEKLKVVIIGQDPYHGKWTLLFS